MKSSWAEVVGKDEDAKGANRASTGDRTNAPTDVKARFMGVHELQNRRHKCSLSDVTVCQTVEQGHVLDKSAENARTGASHRNDRKFAVDCSVFVVAALRKGLMEELGVTSRVLRIFAEQALEGC